MSLKRCLPAALVVAVLGLSTPKGVAAPDWLPGKKFLIVRSVESWNADQKKNFTVELKRCGFFKKSENSVVGFTGSVVNNSNETIRSVIFDFILQNGKSNVEVLRVRFAIQQSVFKTATVEFKDAFTPASFAAYDPKREEAKSFYELVEAAKQLGDDFGWRYELIGAVPDSIARDAGYDVERAMKVDVVLF